jgi:ankyrin repeat protein
VRLWAAIFAIGWTAFAADTLVDDLHKAARAGDLQRVEELIARGAPVNGRDSLGGTPLHDAAWAGETEIVALLIAKGAEVNARHTEGRIDAAALRGDY